MAARTPVNPRRLRNTKNIQQQIDPLGILVDSAATWAAGEFLRRASDGLLYEGTTSAASGVGDDAITHWAITDHLTANSDDTGKEVVADVLASDVWEINTLEETAITDASRGLEYGMDVTSNVCTLSTAITTHLVFRIVNTSWNERLYQDNSADTYPRLTVQVLQTAIDATPTN